MSAFKLFPRGTWVLFGQFIGRNLRFFKILYLLGEVSLNFLKNRARGWEVGITMPSVAKKTHFWCGNECGGSEGVVANGYQ